MDKLAVEPENVAELDLAEPRAALWAIASNTGCTSEGELAITFRMSAVAVCCSSARSSSVVRRSSCTCRSATKGAGWRVMDDAIPRLVLADLCPFCALVLRALALVAFLPIFSTRTISAPGSKAGILSVWAIGAEGVDSASLWDDLPHVRNGSIADDWPGLTGYPFNPRKRTSELRSVVSAECSAPRTNCGALSAGSACSMDLSSASSRHLW